MARVDAVMDRDLTTPVADGALPSGVGVVVCGVPVGRGCARPPGSCGCPQADRNAHVVAYFTTRFRWSRRMRSFKPSAAGVGPPMPAEAEVAEEIASLIEPVT